MPSAPKKKTPAKDASREELEKRAAARGYTLEQEGHQWYAVIGGTRWGPMQSLDEIDEFLPKE
jgi:hypothetical protein